MKTKKKPMMPDELVQEYLRLMAKINPLEKKVKPLKEKILALHDKGYIHPSIAFQECERQAIPWNTLVNELLEKQFDGDEKKIKLYYKKLDERFPRAPITPSIKPTGV
jgi:hypothetical protein